MLIVTRRLVLLAATLSLGLAAPAAFAQDKLMIGSYPANPPWENKKEDGSFEGFEVDMINAVGKKLGVPVEIADYDFQALFAATSSGRIDCAISTISITPERMQNQSFTQGYYDNDMALVGKADNGIKSLADMKGKVVGAIATSIGEAWIKEKTGEYGFGELKSYKAQQDLLLDLQNGRLDGGVGDIVGFEFAFAKMTDLAVKERIKTADQYGLMCKKGHPMLDKINAAITELKQDGTMAALHKKWLGVDAGAGTATVEERPLPQ